MIRIKIPRNIDEEAYKIFWKNMIVKNAIKGIYIIDEYYPVLISKSFKSTDMFRITNFAVYQYEQGKSFIEAKIHWDYYYNDIESAMIELSCYNKAKNDTYLLIND